MGNKSNSRKKKYMFKIFSNDIFNKIEHKVELFIKSGKQIPSFIESDKFSNVDIYNFIKQ